MGKDSCEEMYENIRTLSKERKKTGMSCSCRLWWCFGIVCFLLVGSVVVNVWMGLQVHEQKATFHNLTMEMGTLQNHSEELKMKYEKLQNHSEELTHENNKLNLWLNSILKFKTFPVSEYCKDKMCQPCQKGWVEFQKKCYLFFNGQPWKTWDKSQQHCKNNSADLVAIDHLQEQEFLSNHCTYYYDEFHGYWLGLREINKRWVWTDGRNDTLGYWMGTNYGPSGPYALLIPGKNLTNNWDTSDSAFQNKFICEQEALIKLEMKPLNFWTTRKSQIMSETS